MDADGDADAALSRDASEPGHGPDARGAHAGRKALTIGAVCKLLAREFPDISISKIRYLEDQKLRLAAPHPGRLPALLADGRHAGCARSCASSATSSCRCG